MTELPELVFDCPIWILEKNSRSGIDTHDTFQSGTKPHSIRSAGLAGLQNPGTFLKLKDIYLYCFIGTLLTLLVDLFTHFVGDIH